MRNFHIYLKQIRTAEKKTQKEVAEAIGIAYQSYQAYENGLTFPTLENFIKLCDYFDMSPNEILGIRH